MAPARRRRPAHHRAGAPAVTIADSPARQLDRYLQMIVGDRRGDELLEIRYATGDREMRRRFVPIRSLDAAARAIRALSSRADVYCGVLLRSHRAGGRDAVTSSHIAFVDVDAVDALDRLQRFARPPTMIVSSGSAGHAHAYWTLRTRVGVLELEQANRTLASHLGGDLASVDAARILRPLSVGRADGADVSPARSFADASSRDDGGPR